MPLRDEVVDEIRGFVRGGFEDRDRIVEILTEELYSPGELDQTEVEDAVDAEISALDAEKNSWPDLTDCDKLDEVFAALNERGVIALQNAGYTQSDGYDDVMQVYHDHPHPNRVIGYCYYHGQDLERAVRGQGLNFAFGPINPKLEESDGPVVGRLIVQELQGRGFDVKWNGTFAQRINVPTIDWKRR